MRTFKLLVLTDHSQHSSENSLYAFLSCFIQHPAFEYIAVASRGHNANTAFFNRIANATLWGTILDTSFGYSMDGDAFGNMQTLVVDDYDIVWLRLPPPLEPIFLQYIEDYFYNKLIINKPSGILETAGKSFLLNYPSLIAPSMLIHSFEELRNIAKEYPIVIKPLNSYGGKGIFKIINERVDYEGQSIDLEIFMSTFDEASFPVLGVKYLKNVTFGDKRIVVVNGEIMGASLRLPKKGDWLCNISRGGTSQWATVENEEREIIEALNPAMKSHGIFMYGIDTLLDDEGKRVLSELNTTSIGGLPQIAKYLNEPLVERMSNLFYDYCVEQIA